MPPYSSIPPTVSAVDLPFQFELPPLEDDGTCTDYSDETFDNVVDTPNDSLPPSPDEAASPKLSHLSFALPAIVPGSSLGQRRVSLEHLETQGKPASGDSHKSKKPYRCTVCDLECTDICSVCRSAPYCSKSCQTLDRPYHKHLCNQYQPFLADRFILDGHVGFYFLPDTPGPHLIWIVGYDGYIILPFMATFADGKSVGWREPIIGSDDPELRWEFIQESRVKGFPIDHLICGGWRASFLDDGSPPNISIRKFMDWEQKHDWRGPVFFVATRDAKLIDLTLKDLRTVKDFFETAGDEYAGLTSIMWTIGREIYPETKGWVKCVNDMFKTCRRTAKDTEVSTSLERENQPMWKLMKNLANVLQQEIFLPPAKQQRDC